jgi:hypothetical protein
MREKGMLILECTSERQERMSEGLLIKELIRILEPSIIPNVVPARGVSSFKKALRDSSETVIHVSAHGRYYYKKTTKLDFPSKKSITTDEKHEQLLKRSEKPVLMVFSACSVGNKDMVKSLNDAGVKYFIAPTEDVDWFDAALFLTLFYRFLFVEERSPWIAYRNSDRIRKKFFPKLTGRWYFFQ